MMRRWQVQLNSETPCGGGDRNSPNCAAPHWLQRCRNTSCAIAAPSTCVRGETEREDHPRGTSPAAAASDRRGLVSLTCALPTFSGLPPHAFNVDVCSARPKEKERCHGRASSSVGELMAAHAHRAD
jgi:hypothetical protein